MFSSLDVSVLAHATEDDNKITKVILEYFKKSSSSKHIEVIITEGHWKNPITRINITFLRHLDEYFNNIINDLTRAYGKDELDLYLKNNVDLKGSIYLRLDKQKLCLGKLELSDNDAVRIVFRQKGKFEK
ncbi:MAG TPA: RNA-binding domain-containing protein [Candidatus Nitrosocosmicus sp.]|nr:RNA-binding domain-containing protein [Candidatus Nitrosocosmicus sp.]